ncbi:hypothetical protein JCM14244_04820 [Venenivibrio stagnispumantis]|nr:hypothetical protein [Venenivibrio stagnispumantis]MCW4573805.1 hypothetical protein [Venenivibrio stagnispumantis]
MINERRLTEEKLKEIESTIKFIKENINAPIVTAKYQIKKKILSFFDKI